jgi:pimeloyl-ACP methyl ester carboxylesterase
MLMLMLTSPQGVEQYQLSVLASDVQQAVQALGHSSCTLVAHDWGGTVAWAVAGMYGRQVRHCIQC